MLLVNRLPHHQCLRPQVNANGSVLLSEIVGSIKLKVFLSGMPELRLGLNDRVLFELTGRKFLEGSARGSLRPRLIWGGGTRRPAVHSEIVLVCPLLVLTSTAAARALMQTTLLHY